MRYPGRMVDVNCSTEGICHTLSVLALAANANATQRTQCRMSLATFVGDQWCKLRRGQSAHPSRVTPNLTFRESSLGIKLEFMVRASRPSGGLIDAEVISVTMF